jgi:hypothetical protein
MQLTRMPRQRAHLFVGVARTSFYVTHVGIMCITVAYPVPPTAVLRCPYPFRLPIQFAPAQRVVIRRFRVDDVVALFRFPVLSALSVAVPTLQQ